MLIKQNNTFAAVVQYRVHVTMYMDFMLLSKAWCGPVVILTCMN